MSCLWENHFSKVCLSRVNSVEEHSLELKANEVSSSSEDENEFIIQSVEVQQGREELPDEFCIQKEMPLVGPMMFEDYCDDKVRCEMINRVSNESQTRNVHQVSQWTANLPTNGKNVEYKLDTGAEVNVLPKFLFDQLYSRPN